MTGFLERLTTVIHWLAFLCACLILIWHFTINQSPDITWVVIGSAFAINSAAWLIKFIFTGNGSFLPF
ncbi:MAG TPA: hypothetical protein DHV86_07555 [Methylophilaceae bacterium]|jgi:hypothetical protein|nr:hypothetical protein [Methylophilaceae bacterium]|tara:strand:- start:124 stop:327 length:204 start_codon:yes stop_codon:yes gene_type:complete